MKSRKELEITLLEKLSRKKLYFNSIEECLLNGVRKDQFINDLLQCDGKELFGTKPKFFSISSSSALAINSFAFWKDNLNYLVFSDQTNFFKISFEKKFENGLYSRIKPNIDIVLENSHSIFAIESKFLEFLKSPKVEFSEQYVRIADARKFTVWYDTMIKLKNGTIKYKYFDAAQIIKHYFGLSFSADVRSKKLVYLFWLPIDRSHYSEYIVEIEHFANELKNATDVTFHYLEYSTLWDYWAEKVNNDFVALYLENLKNRYLI